ncbi:hypothetical protein ACHAW5_006867 [Stephanodiscus triporus]|uniref:Cytochrome C biogenesis protein transmembrane domain-containing protein n=1 Tax=Stephanodiscus triporus TaxID=2934178 RepID=A0ABD3N163_9STRA
MPFPRRQSSPPLLRAWIACIIAIPAHEYAPVDSFSSPGSRSIRGMPPQTSALALLGTTTTHPSERIRRRRRGGGGDGGEPGPAAAATDDRSPRDGGGRCRRSRGAATTTTERRRRSAAVDTALRVGLEDAIFAAQGIGSSLADAVISSSSSSSSAASPRCCTPPAFGRRSAPASLGLLPITVSYISTATNDSDDGNTIAPTLAFAAGLATVFTALGVSASALGGVFGGVVVGGDGGGGSSASALSALASLVEVLMGLQLLELIRVPLPSLDFGLRRIALAFDGGGTGRRRGRGGVGGGGGSLFEENGGLVLGTMTTMTTAEEEDDGEGYDATSALLVRTFLLGGTSALVASPCATPVLTSLLAYLASASTSTSTASSGDVWRGASWMLSYTLGYSTPLLAVGATGGQALVNLRRARDDADGDGFNLSASLGQWVNPLTGGVLIVFGMNGLLVALLGDPSVSALAPIID